MSCPPGLDSNASPGVASRRSWWTARATTSGRSSRRRAGGAGGWRRPHPHIAHRRRAPPVDGRQPGRHRPVECRPALGVGASTRRTAPRWPRQRVGHVRGEAECLHGSPLRRRRRTPPTPASRPDGRCGGTRCGGPAPCGRGAATRPSAYSHRRCSVAWSTVSWSARAATVVGCTSGTPASQSRRAHDGRAARTGPPGSAQEVVRPMSAPDRGPRSRLRATVARPGGSGARRRRVGAWWMLPSAELGLAPGRRSGAVAAVSRRSDLEGSPPWTTGPAAARSAHP